MNFTEVRRTEKYSIQYAIVSTDDADIVFAHTRAYTNSDGIQVPEGFEAIVSQNNTVVAVGASLYTTPAGARNLDEKTLVENRVLLRKFEPIKKED